MSDDSTKYPRIIVLGYSEAGMFLRQSAAADIGPTWFDAATSCST